MYIGQDDRTIERTARIAAREQRRFTRDADTMERRAAGDFRRLQRLSPSVQTTPPGSPLVSTAPSPGSPIVVPGIPGQPYAAESGGEGSTPADASAGSSVMPLILGGVALLSLLM